MAEQIKNPKVSTASKPDAKDAKDQPVTTFKLARPKRKIFTIDTPQASVVVRFNGKTEWAVNKIAVGAEYEYEVKGDRIAFDDEGDKWEVLASRSQLLMMARLMHAMAQQPQSSAPTKTA